MRTTVGVLGIIGVFASGGAGHGYIDAMNIPLEQFNGAFAVIAEGVVEKVDAGKKVGVIRIGKALRGKPDYTHVRLNAGAGPGWHAEGALKHLVPGAPVVVWSYWGAGPKSAVYLNRFFLECWHQKGEEDPGKVWWHLNAVATLYNRTYNGSVEDLRELLPRILSGETKGPAVDPKRPPITREALLALPAWGEPVDPRRLPHAFRGRSTVASKPREPDAPGPLARGLRRERYDGTWEALPDFGRLKPVSAGTCESIGLGTAAPDAGYGLRFSGYLEVPRDGLYTFTLVSNDGSRLEIGETVVVDNDHFKMVLESSGQIALKAGKHPIRVDYFQHGGFQVLEVLWEGPGAPRRTIPATAFWRTR